MVITMAMFFCSCGDSYERVGKEAKELVYPQGVAEDFTLTYTESANKVGSEDKEPTHLVAVLTSPKSDDYDNLTFPYRTFPNGLRVEFFDEKNNKSTLQADYGIIYSLTNLIDLQGNVVIESSDGKKLETTQLYWDRNNDWIFTQAKFTFTNPEDGTVMDGEGMDFNRDLSIFKAAKTFGLIAIKEN